MLLSSNGSDHAMVNCSLLQSQQNGNGGIGIGQGPPSQHDTTTESSTNGSIKDRKETREELMQRHGFH